MDEERRFEDGKKKGIWSKPNYKQNFLWHPRHR
nr:MAG TPA: two-partite extracellular sensor domain protein [Caudoviricetes sp.]